MLRFSFARFSSFAFVVRCFVTLRVGCRLFTFLFRVPFCFGCFRFYLLLLAFWSFSLWLVFLCFFRFLSSSFTTLHAWFSRFFCQFRYGIICLCVQCPFCSVSRVFHFWPLLLFMAFGIARFCSFGPSWTTLSVRSCSCLVFVALSRALFSHSFS